MPPKTVNTPGRKIMPLPTSHSGAMHTSVGTVHRPQCPVVYNIKFKIHILYYSLYLNEKQHLFQLRNWNSTYFCQGQWFTENCSAEPKLFWSDTPDFHTKCLRVHLMHLGPYYVTWEYLVWSWTLLQSLWWHKNYTQDVFVSSIFVILQLCHFTALYIYRTVKWQGCLYTWL